MTIQLMMTTTTPKRVITRIVTEIFLRDENVAMKITKTTTIEITISVTQGVIADQLIISGEIREIMEMHQDQFYKKLEVHVMEFADDSITSLGEIFMCLA